MAWRANQPYLALGSGILFAYPQIATICGVQGLVVYTLSSSLPLLIFGYLGPIIRRKCPEGFVLTGLYIAKCSRPCTDVCRMDEEALWCAYSAVPKLHDVRASLNSSSLLTNGQTGYALPLYGGGTFCCAANYQCSYWP